MNRLWRRWRVARSRAADAERRFGWLFPVLAPFCVIAAGFILVSVPLVAHWQAVRQIEAIGGSVSFATSPAAFWPGPSPAILTRVDRVELTGPHITDHALEPLANLRGLSTLVVRDTRITEQALGDLQSRHPQLIIKTER